MKVEEETQPRWLGSTPTPPHPTREALATGEVLAQVPCTIALPTAPPHGKPAMGSGRCPTPEHSTAIVSREGAHRAWAGSWNTDGAAAMLRHLHALA